MILALTAMLALSQPVICIDPGHPSEVGLGTRGLKVTEVEVAWTVGQDLKAALERQGYRVVLTKGSLNEKVLNPKRAEIANQARARLMVRLHCDASSGRGFTVYYPTQVGTVDGVTGPSKEVLSSSAQAARRFYGAFSDSLKGKLHDDGLKSDIYTAVGSKQGALTGSIFSQVPVVLVEMVVLTNRQDEAFILSRSGHRAMVDALAAGVGAVVKA